MVARSSEPQLFAFADGFDVFEAAADSLPSGHGFKYLLCNIPMYDGHPAWERLFPGDRNTNYKRRQIYFLAQNKSVASPQHHNRILCYFIIERHTQSLGLQRISAGHTPSGCQCL